jgi:MFS family permease
VANTREALLGLVRAHVDLAKAEADEIKGEVARAAALGAFALACVLFLGLLLGIGLFLFLGEAVFGSMGWGLLHGTLLLVALAVFAGLLAIRVPRLGAMFLVALVTGAVVAVLMGAHLPNEAWRRIGEGLNVGVDPGVRPLLVGTLVIALVGGLVGLLLGYRGGAAVGGLFGGLVLGAIVGALSALTPGWRVGIALGITVWLLAWPVLMGVTVAREGVDGEALKARFWPQTTIDTTKETIEWAKARMPLGPRS